MLWVTLVKREQKVFLTFLVSHNTYLIPSSRWGGGGAKGPPCGFSQIAPEVLGISL